MRGTTKKQDDGKNGRMWSSMICTFIKCYYNDKIKENETSGAAA
jgi:hypothetical protein